MRLKGITTSLLTVPIEFNDRVFKTTSFESDYWSSTYKELMLYDTTWLKNRRHQTKISTSIYKSAICKELLWSRPEAMWVLVSELPHSVSATCRVGLSHVGGSTDQELYFVVKFLDNVFSYI